MEHKDEIIAEREREEDNAREVRRLYDKINPNPPRFKTEDIAFVEARQLMHYHIELKDGRVLRASKDKLTKPECDAIINWFLK